MSYLNRYLQGEHEAVWDELQTLGAEIYNQPLYDDALGVVRETMRRVRANIEMLIPRLAQIGLSSATITSSCKQLPIHYLAGRRIGKDTWRRCAGRVSSRRFSFLRASESRGAPKPAKPWTGGD
ncbi:MAG TPA: hypothetical protein VF510_18445 [Ktedonobacterales bacterium]